MWREEETMYAYQKTNHYFAQIADGLEELGKEELLALGAGQVRPVFRGLYFVADQAALYRVNYCSRLCTRILAPLLSFDCHSAKYLYRTARKLNWEDLLAPGLTFAVTATVSHSRLRHSHYAALCVKDAVVDRLRELRGWRPDVDRRNPDLWLNLHLQNNRAVLSMDTSGGSLHRRGYRLETLEAPMQETLAAAILQLSGWRGEQPLIDPLCGSGTLLAEALMRYCRIPAGYLRARFGFEHLPDFKPEIWRAVKREADQSLRALPPGLVSGSDASAEAVAAAKSNLARLPEGGKIDLRVSRFQNRTRVEGAVLVSNPPYGRRLQRTADMDAFMKEVGNFLKRRCPGSTAFLYLGDRQLVKQVGLKASWKRPLKNGGLAGMLVKYELY